MSVAFTFISPISNEGVAIKGETISIRSELKWQYKAEKCGNISRCIPQTIHRLVSCELL
jgi:hypothetical protein